MLLSRSDGRLKNRPYQKKNPQLSLVLDTENAGRELWACVQNYGSSNSSQVFVTPCEYVPPASTLYVDTALQLPHYLCCCSRSLLSWQLTGCRIFYTVSAKVQTYLVHADLPLCCPGVPWGALSVSAPEAQRCPAGEKPRCQQQQAAES